MNFTIAEILQLENFKDFNRETLISMINVLKYDLKYLKYQENKDRHKLIDTINGLQHDVNTQKILNEKLGNTNKILSKKLFRKLTFWERIKGKIDVNI